MTNGFIKLMRTQTARDLRRSNPVDYMVLTEIAEGAQFEDNAALGLKAGEAIVPSLKTMRLSRQQLRGALKRLSKRDFLTIRTTNRGTIARLANSSVYDLGKLSATISPTNKQPSSNHQATTIKERKNERKKEINPIPVDQELWDEYLKTRKIKGAPNTPRALNTLINKINLLVTKGHSATALVEEANAQGWKSVYPPKDDTNGKPSREQITRELLGDSGAALGDHAPVVPVFQTRGGPAHQSDVGGAPAAISARTHRGSHEPDD